MGQAKLKQRTAFAPDLVSEWESDLCVNFAVALARLSGWILHVDWWTPSADRNEEVAIDRMRPLRAYVGDNHDRIFDVRGVRSLEDFMHKTVRPLAERFGNGAVRTRFYEEEALCALPIGLHLNEDKVVRAIDAINQNGAYLSSIPKRQGGGLPSHQAATFTFGRCGPFTEALKERTGLPAVALIAQRFKPLYGLGEPGYVHSMVMHPNGLAEDAWGLSTVDEIAERFGLAEYHLSSEEHDRVIATLKRNTPEQYDLTLTEARQAIATHRSS
jgi:hypothetical protein